MIIDIFNFFFQLLIYFDYYNRFIFINQQKIKYSKIIFIKFTNSFLYIQYFINRTLKTYNNYYRIFIDNIIIFSDIFNNYIEYLKDIFSLFREKNININLKKSYIKYPTIELLGYYIDTLKIYSIEDRM